MHRRISQTQRKDTRSTHEPTKAATRQSTSSFRIHIALSQADEEHCREELREVLEALTGHPIFHLVLSFVMSLAERKFSWQELPQDCWKWDQKGWSHLCKVTRTGLQDDGGNWCYGIAVIVMAGACTQIPEHWRLAEYSDVRRLCRKKAKPHNVDSLVEAAGDILEAMGGVVTWQHEAGRTFCTEKEISEAEAKEFLSIISAYVQKVSLLVGECDQHDLVAAVSHVQSGLRTFSYTAKEVRLKTHTSVHGIFSRSAQDGMHSTEPFERRHQENWPGTTARQEEFDARRYSPGASASSSWLPLRFPQTHRYSDCHYPCPRPERHGDDARFEPSVRQRIIYCDKCRRPYSWESFGFDGAYMYKCPEAEKKALKTEALQVRFIMYLAGTWDATWWCTECWLKYFQWERPLPSTMDAVRERLGIAAIHSKEYGRKRDRTWYGTFTKNVMT